MTFVFSMDCIDWKAPGALHETTVWVKMSQDVYDRFDKKGEGYQ